jgi:hypothetical protein
MLTRLLCFTITFLLRQNSHAVVQRRVDTGRHDHASATSRKKVLMHFTKNAAPARARTSTRSSRVSNAVIGERLLTQKIASHDNENIVIASLFNLWNSFGRCICKERIGASASLQLIPAGR